MCQSQLSPIINIFSLAESFGKMLLAAHNKLRDKHGSPHLQWSKPAAAKAKSWARHLANIGKLQHGNHEGMGQNLAYKSGQDLTAQEVGDMWYNEISHYDYNRPGFSSNTGHFTQLVWAGTSHMGAARVTKGNHSYVVANYTPPGNITNPGQFERNVKRPK